jgi:hypothetical protein
MGILYSAITAIFVVTFTELFSSFRIQKVAASTPTTVKGTEEGISTLPIERKRQSSDQREYRIESNGTLFYLQ